MIAEKIERFLTSKYFLWLILLAAFIVRVVIAFLFENILWPDEIFQSVEQAHRLVFGNGLIPWEFREGLRSYLFPGFLGLLLFPFKLIPINNSLIYVGFIKIALSLTSLSLVYFSYQYARLLGYKYGAIFAASFAAFWYELIYFAPKSLTSVFAAYLIFPGLYFGQKALQGRGKKNFALAALSLALAGILRIQYTVLFFLPIFLAPFFGFRLKDYKEFRPYFLTGFAIALFSGLLDWITWGVPFWSTYYNIYFNLIKSGASGWGTMPFWGYLQLIWNTWGILLPLSLVLAALSWQKNKLALLALLFNFLLHSYVPHKEYRFIFLCLPLLLISASFGLDGLLSKLKEQWLRIGTLVLVITCFLIYSITLAGNYSYNSLGYKGDHRLVWSGFQTNILVYRYLSTVDDLWGLQDNLSSWEWSGGYYHLHHDVPIYSIRQLNYDKIFKNKYANYLITRAFIYKPGLKLIKTINGVYIYQKTFLTEKKTDPSYTLNR